MSVSSATALLAALRVAAGNKSAAARALGISRQRVGQLVAALTDEEYRQLSPYYRPPGPDRCELLPSVRVSRDERLRVEAGATAAGRTLAQHIRARLLD